MSDYALVLYFDAKTSSRLQSLIHLAESACGSSNMTDPAVIPPHVTVCCFSADSADKALSLIENEVNTVEQGRLVWSSIGAFPDTLFVTPICNAYLLDLCTRFNKLLEPHVDLNKYYQPFMWMPHTTLATKVDQKQLVRAFEAVSAQFVPMTGIATHINLVQCDPFKELKTWELEPMTR
jgi:2'-5' RNA ligase